jgi:hypothetical protein
MCGAGKREAQKNDLLVVVRALILGLVYQSSVDDIPRARKTWHWDVCLFYAHFCRAAIRRLNPVVAVGNLTPPNNSGSLATFTTLGC